MLFPTRDGAHLNLVDRERGKNGLSNKKGKWMLRREASKAHSSMTYSQQNIIGDGFILPVNRTLTQKGATGCMFRWKH